MTQLAPVENEDDFRALLRLESVIHADAGLRRFPAHHPRAAVDRWLFGRPEEVFRYAYLLTRGGEPIGYAMAYNLYPGEKKFALNLLPGCAEYAAEALRLIEGLTARGNKRVALYINNLDQALVRAAKKRGYRRPLKQARRQMGLDLSQYQETPVAWENETLARLTPDDFGDRARYSKMATGRATDAARYESFYRSEYYKAARDYVIRANDGAYAGHLIWWIDAAARTASLELAATVPEFRRRGIMRRAILDGLNLLKAEGIQYAYVSTSARNRPAQALYEGAGFAQLGKTYLYEKRLRGESKSCANDMERTG